MRTSFAALSFALAAGLASADTIKLTNGGTLEGVVLRETDAGYVVKLKYGTVTLPRSDVVSVEKSKAEPAKAGSGRLAVWEKCVETVIARPWAADFRPIPATVIDKGILKNVPYFSHKSGDYEFNIYGDPDAPACLEIGVTKELLKSDAAKKECLAVMLELLPDARDKDLLKSLSLAQDKKEREGLTLEVTPETAEDAYGGWWISIYDVKLLDAARATEKELAEITVTKEEIEEDDKAEKKDPPKKDPPKADPPKPPKTGSSGAHPAYDYGWYRWVKKDLPHTRDWNRIQARPHVARYYVRSYHRPAGSYQRPAGCPRR